MSVSWHERWGFGAQEFSAAGVRTFAVVEGKPDAFPVVFLHGVPGASFIWAPIVAAVGRERLCIAPDLPGWGRSVSRFEKGLRELSPWGMREWFFGVLSSHRIERCDVIAHGSGAWIALEALVDSPSRIRRLGLISARLRHEPTPLLPRLLGPFGRRDSWSRNKILSWVEHEGWLSPGARETWGDSFAQLVPATGANRCLPAMSEAEFAKRFDAYRNALSSYSGAALLLWGENDSRVSQDEITQLSALMDRPEIHRIPEAGFFPTLDCAEKTAEVLREFLSG